MSRDGRFRQIDALRGLAALSVVFFHVAFRFPIPRTQLGQYVSQRSAGPPITAVVLFFLISGFVLYRPFVAARFEGRPPPSLRDYAIRRFARIAPGYWVTLALVSAWLGFSYMLTPRGFIRYFGFLQLYAPNSTVAGGISVAWSLCVEVTFYATLPLLALAARRIGRRGGSIVASEISLCAAMVLTSLAWQLIITVTVHPTSDWLLPLLSMLPGSLDLFAGGMALAVLSVESEHRTRRRPADALITERTWLPWLVALGILYGEGRVPASAGTTGWWMSTHALKLLACALLLAPVVTGARDRGPLRRVLASPPLVWIGTVSYGIYLWHKPVLDKLAPHLVPHGELYTAVAVTALSISLAAVTYYLVERPAQLLARRYIASHRSRPPPGAQAELVAAGAAPPPGPQ